MNFRKKTESTPPFINVISLVDVMLILLIFFAVSTSFLQAGAIRVDLPKAQTTVEEASKEMVRVVVTKDNRYFVNETVVSEKDLRDALKKAHDEKPLSTLVIEADTASLHGVVVKVIDDGKLAGFERFAIATEEPE